MAELTFDDIANLAEPLPVPHSFARLVVADLRQMTQQAQLVAAAAAVIGGAMPVAVLGTTARVDGLLSAVDELQASEHFVVKGSGTELTLEFGRPLRRRHGLRGPHALDARVSPRAGSGRLPRVRRRCGTGSPPRQAAGSGTRGGAGSVRRTFQQVERHPPGGPRTLSSPPPSSGRPARNGTSCFSSTQSK